jgi:glycosyltransferase involved in cell wall biosynthesis
MLYAYAVALVSPSTYEGFGLPVLEVMVRGTPVIAWDIPVGREVVGDAGMLLPCGRVEELAQTMRRLGEDARFRSEFRKKGQDRVQRFSWRAAAELFLTMLHEAKQGKSVPGALAL